jgi:F0F1-type ATP synthase assembly protein I
MVIININTANIVQAVSNRVRQFVYNLTGQSGTFSYYLSHCIMIQVIFYHIKHFTYFNLTQLRHFTPAIAVGVVCLKLKTDIFYSLI